MTQPEPSSPALSEENADPCAITARGVRKVYKGGRNAPDVEALKGIDLMVPRGSIFGLLGPNGAGKSTFINILAGLVTKTAGDISVWGFDIDKNARQVRASLGIVPQETSSDAFFTPAEGLEIQAGLYGVPKSRRRTREILEVLGLGDKANAYVRQLSGGMKRRLLVGKAMVHSPPVLILDEPTAGVDIELRKQMWEQIVQMHEQGVTVILTTHYLEEAQELCDRIAIIHHGEVKTCQPKDQLISSLDQKTLMVTPKNPILALPELGGNQADLRADGSLYITYRPSDTTMGDLLGAISAAGIEVRDLSTLEADLEDVFMQMTYGAD